MAAIRDRDTKPEMYVRRALHAAGFRFRLHRRDLPGNPDLVLVRYRVAAFVHGCFWHGHRCKISHTPKSNTAYWSAKIERNMVRDAETRAKLTAANWRVVTVWECSLVDGTHQLITDLIQRREADALTMRHIVT